MSIWQKNTRAYLQFNHSGIIIVAEKPVNPYNTHVWFERAVDRTEITPLCRECFCRGCVCERNQI